ncbi:4-alpha-glucanotransferase [Acerihabitans sp. TG2]|uniref:4-alpha-glucanotransferase n=1 Tax=Acerihabitans sp. TG2 TaxID=3096008 RepID=UPI002B22A745|nr:4-alpha-glucanotransferase [Acerihabitans sp. TG2]MEA9390925.1 4-alpha-glucanotransferase [Acerihabitans sp. TG2]
MDPKVLDEAAERAGISPEYIDAWGQRKIISQETKRQLLDAMVGRRDQAGQSPVPPVWVIRPGDVPSLALELNDPVEWVLTEELGRQHEGSMEQYALTLPDSLPLGYHRLAVRSGLRHWRCQVIVAPARCYEPAALLAGQKLWGACIQLYTLRSRHNWGVGDFGDLALMLEGVAKQGGAFVGLNPIHALYPATPAWASPYSPSSRRWLNILYINVGALEDFVQSVQAQQWWSLPLTQSTLAALREDDVVDYAQVTQCKLTALTFAYEQFSRRGSDDKQYIDFVEFIRLGGESLRYQATFDALHRYLTREGHPSAGWQHWPVEYQQADSPQVREFSQRHHQEIRFFSWMQWVAARQFDQCFELSQRLNMPIGLYRDVAVGVSEGGMETWSDRTLYCLAAAVGAPPDRLGPQGQNWNLPPQDPNVLVARAYEPFIEMLRANMHHCGALRLDHVMSLLRLWWVPAQSSAVQGAYVSYPVDDLLAILALESHRQHCMVIGEDLGTVPREITEKLHAAGIYSYKVLFFERTSPSAFRSPTEYVSQAMATLTTHDLATLRGYWQQEDLRLGQRLKLYPDDAVYQHLLHDRQLARQALLDALHHWKCVPVTLSANAERVVMSPVLNRGIHRYVARSHSALLGLQPEDWLGMALPVNVPGTTDQYPNWRRKLTCGVVEMFDDPAVIRLLKEVNRLRKAAVAKTASLVVRKA